MDTVIRSYKKGDIIMYEGGKIPVTHRIINIYRDENGTEWIVTKGDANNTEDEAFTSDKIIGRVVLVLPKLGELETFFSKPSGFLVLTLITGGLLCLPDLIKHIKKKVG